MWKWNSYALLNATIPSVLLLLALLAIRGAKNSGLSCIKRVKSMISDPVGSGLRDDAARENDVEDAEDARYKIRG